MLFYSEIQARCYMFSGKIYIHTGSSSRSLLLAEHSLSSGAHDENNNNEVSTSRFTNKRSKPKRSRAGQ